MSERLLLSPPRAEARPQSLLCHGHRREDPYHWLKERENPEVLAYLEAENAYTESVMAHIGELRQKLYEEMIGRIQETDMSVPERVGPFLYYTRTEEGSQYPIYCRKPAGGEANGEEVLLNPNHLARGEYLKVGVLEVSPDHRLLAYSLDTTGAEVYTLFVKDLSTGELLPDEIPNTSYSVEWAGDSQTLFYTVRDEAWRNYKLFRHVLGGSPATDVELYHEPDALFTVDLYRTRDRKYIVLYVSAIETSEVHLLRASNPLEPFRLVAPRERHIRYFVDHHEGTFYIVTNDGGARNFKVVTAPADNPGKAQWQEFIPHRQTVKIDGVDAFKNHLVISEREGGLKTLRIMDLKTGGAHRVSFPEPVYSFTLGDNPEYDTRLLRFTYSSLITPDSIFDYDMDTRERALKKRKPVLGGYDPDDYVSERIMALAPDGVEVPISLLYRRDLVRDGQAPCLLYGYGAYGMNVEPTFNSNRLSLVDRDFVFALAHIRGGQELGRQWYDDGKFLNKKNSFTDFVACAQHLIEAGYTRREKLAILGGSAGGLLIGAVLNLAPDLFQVAVAKVPFVDVVTTMLDESIPLTVGEYDEWGNPNDETYYRYMLSYSPYDNVRPTDYPHLLVTSGLNDPRVQYWEPAKWVARLRVTRTDSNRLLLKTNMGAGHAGASGRYDYLKEIAFDFAFILDSMALPRSDW